VEQVSTYHTDGTVDELTIRKGDSPFEDVLYDMLQLHYLKRRDYAGDGHPNQNFYDTAYQLSSTAGLSVEQLLATKAARLRVLLPALTEGAKPANESIEDTLLDRAVYAVIALTVWREGGYARGPQGVTPLVDPYQGGTK
jgi:hypothetical protein